MESPRGWRIAKTKAGHKIDVVIALAMACLACVKGTPWAAAGGLDEWVEDRERFDLALLKKPHES